MIFSNFLSRQRLDKSSPHEIIPISFNMKARLKDRYYSVGNESKYIVQTCAQVKDKGIKLPEVHGVDKGVDPDLKPEWIVRKAQKLMEKSRLEQDREGPSGEINTPIQDQTQVIEESNIREQTAQRQREGISVPQVSQNPNKGIECDKGAIPKNANRPQINETQVPFYPDPMMKPPPRLPDKKIQNDEQIDLDLDIKINKDIEENLPYQEGIISEIYQRPDKSQLIEPPEVVDVIDTNTDNSEIFAQTDRY